MVNIPLMKQSVKENARLWLVTAGMMTVCIVMALNGYPWLYRYLFRLLPVCFTVLAAERMVAGKIEDGTMVYLLTVPGGRRKVLVTQIYDLTVSLFLLFFVMFAVEFVCSLPQKGGPDIGALFLMNLGGFCLHFCLAGIGFLASCVSSDKKRARMLGACLPALFYLLWLLSGLGGIFGILKYMTVFSLFSVPVILDREIWFVLAYPALLLAGAVCLNWSVHIFSRRDLPL